MKTLTSRQKQAMESRNHLVQTATALFNAQGYQKTTVQDICTAAGLSVGVFYHYFGSKNDMLREVQKQKTTELLDMIDTRSTARTHLEAIRELLEFLVIQQSEGDFELVRNALSPASGGMQVDPKLWELTVRVVDSAQQAGELRADWPARDIASDLLLSARGFVFYWCEQEGSFPVLPAFQGFLRRFLSGYIQIP